MRALDRSRGVVLVGMATLASRDGAPSVNKNVSDHGRDQQRHDGIRDRDSDTNQSGSQYHAATHECINFGVVAVGDE